MKWSRILCAVGFVVSTAAFAQVTVSGNEPVSGQTYDSPVTLSAKASSPNGISGWAVYFDNDEVYSSSSGLGGILDTTASEEPGVYTVTIRAWDTTGAYNSVTVDNVTVTTSPLPTPPSNATHYSNLQNQSGNPGAWSLCNSSNKCAGPVETGSSSNSFGNATPSLSGASMGQTSTGSYFNTMYYRHLGCPSGGCTSATNFLDDVWFYVPATTTHLQALEFDPDAYDGSYEYFMSMQCDSASGKWRFWDMAAGAWTVQNASGDTIPTYSCSLLTKTNQWHHFQLYGTMDFASHTYTYETFVVDGVTVYDNIANTYSAKSYSGTPTLNIEQQIDNNSTAGTNTVYYDNYNLSVW